MRGLIWAGVAALVLGGCAAGTSTPLPAGNAPAVAARPRADAGYQLVYSFSNPPDGLRPQGGLVLQGGKLWGTTNLGGVGTCTRNLGCGTVYQVNAAGDEKVMYAFKGGEDGSAPAAGLALLNGKFYGTLSRGGDKTGCPDFSCGAIFEIGPSGAERLVYSFKDGKDGAGPYARLVAFNGSLYGTTARGGGSSACGGGDSGCGTVFKVTPGGKEEVLHSFDNAPDGAVPLGGLTVAGGILYGTTQQGGTDGSGTVFSITARGKETVVYSFKGGRDGSGPVQDLTTQKGVPGLLYGITQNGGLIGTQNCGAGGCGTVYSIGTQGKKTVLYRFKGSPDGTHPYGNVTPVKGVLYGTTGLGGNAACYTGNGCGTIFKLKLSGTGYKETLLYNFMAAGTYPTSGFTMLGGTLYGTSKGGGKYGIGSIFSYTP
jgi:uncharacterized repeat protein (TIGR03803 family)